MPDILASLLLFAAGLVAAFINVAAGGGSSLTLPALIFLGLDASTANGTNRIAVIAQNISAVYSFKQENHRQFDLSIKLSLLTIPGSIAGAIWAVNISNELFEKILAVILICLIIPIFIPVYKRNKDDQVNEKITIPLVISMLAVGFYGGFLQVGVGFLIIASLRYLMKMNLIMVNVHKVFIVLIFMIPAFLIFVFTGNVDWKYGLSLAVGNIIGGWWAAKITVRKGEKFIKFVLVIAIIIIALKLFEVF